MPIDPVTGAAIVGGLSNIASTAMGNRQSWAASLGAWKRNVKQEQKIFERDAAYNSPQAQMERLRAAGLNPNLMYGQGTVGNTSGSVAQMQTPRVEFPDVAGAAFGALKTVSQRQKNDADIRIKAAQEELVRANPYLSPGYVDDLVKNLDAVADLKAQERDFMLGTVKPGSNPDSWRVMESSPGFRKMAAEVELLVQKFDLGTADKKLKAEVLQSKEFENAIKEVSIKFLKDGEITPAVVKEFILRLLGKF